MEGDISNRTIAHFFYKFSKWWREKYILGFFLKTFFANRFISFHDTISEPGAQFLFVLMNTDRSDKKGTHWWSFLDLHSKKEIFLFDSFSFEGFKEFIIQDDKKFISKIFYDVGKFNKKDNKITLVTLKFSIAEYKKLKNFDKLSETTVDLMHLINEYG